MNPRELFGDIDIYLFDQIMKGRFAPGAAILDAGCGYGRNLPYFLQNDFRVYGVDSSAEAIEHVKRLAEASQRSSAENFRVAFVDAMPFEKDFFDAVICNAILHFARDEEHFGRMITEIWRVLKPGGMFFARLASTIGIESRVIPIGDPRARRFHLPDGSDRFLVDEAMLRAYTAQLGGSFLEPIKTVNVENQRCMTTWVLRKNL
jgi:tellurite methyltransferase